MTRSDEPGAVQSKQIEDETKDQFDETQHPGPRDPILCATPTGFQFTTATGSGLRSAVDLMATKALATFASTLSFGDIPPETIAVAKRLVLDSLGCAIAATTLGDACPEVIRVMSGPTGSTILGTSARATAPNAAFANGALVHALNYDAYGNASDIWVLSRLRLRLRPRKLVGVSRAANSWLRLLQLAR